MSQPRTQISRSHGHVALLSMQATRITQGLTSGARGNRHVRIDNTRPQRREIHNGMVYGARCSRRMITFGSTTQTKSIKEMTYAARDNRRIVTFGSTAFLHKRQEITKEKTYGPRGKRRIAIFERTAYVHKRVTKSTNTCHLAHEAASDRDIRLHCARPQETRNYQRNDIMRPTQPSDSDYRLQRIRI